MDNIGLKKKYSSLKMEKHAIVQFKAIAKERGIKGYYKLRKAELIHVLEATRLIDLKVIYLMSRFQLTPWRPSNFARKVKQNIKYFAAKKTCNGQKNSLLTVCKRLKILLSGC